MPVPKDATHTDSDRKWEPKTRRKWTKVELDKESGKVTLGDDPFDPEDPESDWGAHSDGHGHLVVDCGDGIQAAWNELFPPAPAGGRHHHTSGDACTGEKSEEDTEIEVTERDMWFRDFRCSFEVEASMAWKVTSQKWVCKPEGDIVAPNAPGTWQKDGGPTVRTVSKSRKTIFKCC